MRPGIWRPSLPKRQNSAGLSADIFKKKHELGIQASNSPNCRQSTEGQMVTKNQHRDFGKKKTHRKKNPIEIRKMGNTFNICDICLTLAGVIRLMINRQLRWTPEQMFVFFGHMNKMRNMRRLGLGPFKSKFSCLQKKLWPERSLAAVGTRHIASWLWAANKTTSKSTFDWAQKATRTPQHTGSVVLRENHRSGAKLPELNFTELGSPLNLQNVRSLYFDHANGLGK